MLATLSRLLDRLRRTVGPAGRREGTGDDRAGDDAGDVDGNGDDGSVWSLIPSWQYGGAHAESGGLSRAEQERSLAEIQQQADERRGERRSYR